MILTTIPHNLLCVLMKFVVFNAMAVEHPYTPTEHMEADTNRSAFHCLPDTRIVNATNAIATAESAFFQVWKHLTALLHPLQCTTCLKYLLAKFGACMVPMPPLAGEEAESPAIRPAGACSTTAGSWGNEMVL